MTPRSDGQRYPYLAVLWHLASILMVIAATLVFAECYARWKDAAPNADLPTTEPRGTYFVLTATHGHQPAPGYIEPDEYATCGPWIWPNCQRASRPLPIIKRPRYKVALQGCSWTYGTGVNDQHTYAWQLNALYPNIQFDNYGVSDYGAFFTHLRMRDTIAQGQRYDLYIYAFIYDHLYRDLDDCWYKLENCGTYYVFPGYELGHPQKEYRLYPSIWPGEYKFAFTALLHNLYHSWCLQKGCRKRGTPWAELDKQRQSFRENVLAMRDLAKSTGSSFALLGLGLGAKYIYQHTLTDSGIDAEFALSHRDQENCFNGVWGHPNALGHKQIADAVTALLHRQHLPPGIMAANPPLTGEQLPSHSTASTPSIPRGSVPAKK